MPSLGTLRSLVFVALPLAISGCSSGSVLMRPDGTPGPEKCPEEALKAMKILRLRVGDSAWVDLDVNQADTSPITLYEGPIESMVNDQLGPLESPARLYG